MQKHAQWTSNRGYAQHLEVLRKIKKHTIVIPGKIKPINRIMLSHRNKCEAQVGNNNKCSQQTVPNDMKVDLGQNKESPAIDMNKQIAGIEMNKENNELRGDKLAQNSDVVKRSKLKHKEFLVSNNLTIRDQQILWDNYYLGKRIIETPSVISKRKLDQDYQKHKRLVNCLTSCSARKTISCDYRLKKLQQYKVEMEVMGDDQRIINKIHQNKLLFLQILQLRFFKVKEFLLQNVILIVRYLHPTKKTHEESKESKYNLQFQETYHNQSHDLHQGKSPKSQEKAKKYKQTSECISFQKLFQYEFYFNLKKKFNPKDTFICVEIQHAKGLRVLSLGYFSFNFQSHHFINRQILNLFHCGKHIGEVIIQSSHGLKNQFIKSGEGMAILENSMER